MNIVSSSDLGSVIRQRRKTLGWTQQRLADEAGVSRDWVLQVERGKDSAEVGLVLRLLRVLNMTVRVSVMDDAVLLQLQEFMGDSVFGGTETRDDRSIG